MKIMKKVILVIVGSVFLCTLCGCGSQADRASRNLSEQADNFNIVRQITVINCFSGDVLYTITGKMSIKKDNEDQQLEITIENDDGSYSKDFIGLDQGVTYVVHQLSGVHTSPYHYTVNFNPKMWIPAIPDLID